MTSKHRPQHANGRARATVAEMDQWQATIRDLPETRTDKIARGRRCIGSSSYDDSLILDATVERMRDDMGL